MKGWIRITVLLTTSWNATAQAQDPKVTVVSLEDHRGQVVLTGRGDRGSRFSVQYTFTGFHV